MECRHLDGKRVLLLFLEKSNPRRTYLLAGLAHWNGANLSVNHGTGVGIPVSRPAVERDGFAPAMLPHLVGDDSYIPMAVQHAAEVSWCAPMLVEEVPEAAHSVPGFLGGLSMGRDGELYLMQVR